MRKAITREFIIQIIVNALAMLIGVVLTWLLGLQGLLGTAITGVVLMVLGSILWNVERTHRAIQFFALAILALLGMSIFIIFTLLTQNRVCTQAVINAAPAEVTMVAPAKDAPNVWTNIAYELKAPPSTGMRILLHSSEFLLGDRTERVITDVGDFASHHGKYAAAGKRVSFSDGVSLGYGEVEKARQAGLFRVIERKWFHLLSDEEVYCQISVDVRVNIVDQR